MLGGNDASRSGRTAAEEEAAAAAAALAAQSCRGAGRQGAEGGAGGAARAAALRRPGGASPPPAFACRAARGVAGVLRGVRRSRRADAAPGSAAGASPTFQRPRGWARARVSPSAPGLTETPSGPKLYRTRSTCRVAGARRHCFHLPRWTLKFNYQLQETARSKTVSPDYLRILSWEEYNRSDEDARMFHFFILLYQVLL
ncbi:unnamed protein product, partial [Rangifer tarandus platyrhynchus]